MSDIPTPTPTGVTLTETEAFSVVETNIDAMARTCERAGRTALDDIRLIADRIITVIDTHRSYCPAEQRTSERD